MLFFNTGRVWEVYAGPRRGSVDFSRVALHEFGHVFGLDHPDEHGQVVSAIMNSKISDLNWIQADDIAGIRAIYGGGGPPPPPPRRLNVRPWRPCTMRPTGQIGESGTELEDPRAA